MVWGHAGREREGTSQKDKGALSPGKAHAWEGAQGRWNQVSRGRLGPFPAVDSDMAARIESSLLSAFWKTLEFLPTAKKKAPNTPIAYFNVYL